MKAYEIVDFADNKVLGILLYYEKERRYIIELDSTLNEWTAPLLLAGYVKQGIHTIPSEIAYAWVKERIVPSERQNISDILNRYHLKEYDENKLLELSEGKCSQDSLYVRKADTLPDYVLKRMNHNLTEFVFLENLNSLCFFEDGTVRLIHLADIGLSDAVIQTDVILKTGKVGCGGYTLTFNDSIEYAAARLYGAGKKLPLSADDFRLFLERNVYDTTQACELMNCSRQNLSYLVKQDMLPVAKSSVGGNLYFKGDLLKNMW